MTSRRSVLTLAAAGTSLYAMNAKRKMTIHLVPGSIGVQLTQEEAIDAAKRHGFESVAPDGEYLA